MHQGDGILLHLNEIADLLSDGLPLVEGALVVPRRGKYENFHIVLLFLDTAKIDRPIPRLGDEEKGILRVQPPPGP